MAVATVAKNVIRFGTCIGAVYYSVAEGVWSTSDQSVGPASKVKHRLLPQTFTFINDVATLSDMFYVEPLRIGYF
ncbi:unnamed protein product [Dicrocoelium dendriticum]|nr:unnamed protein product [Dicrocoelium dendriticum]